MSDKPHPPLSPDTPSTHRFAIGLGARILPFLAILVLALGLLAYHFRPAPTTPKVEALTIHSIAPDFSLHDAQKNERDDPVTLSRLVQNGPVVIIFNMGLHCPTCADQLGKFATRIDDFKKAGVQVVAISPETPDDTRLAIESAGAFPFPLLSDPDNKIARAFGLETPDGGLLEELFLIDQDRRIQLAQRPNEPVGDISQLLDFVRSTGVPKNDREFAVPVSHASP